MEVPERATDSGTLTTTWEVGHEGRRHPPDAFKGTRMKYRTLGRTRAEGGDVRPGSEQRSGL
jgi:hypothetical protein